MAQQTIWIDATEENTAEIVVGDYIRSQGSEFPVVGIDSTYGCIQIGVGDEERGPYGEHWIWLGEVDQIAFEAERE